MLLSPKTAEFAYELQDFLLNAAVIPKHNTQENPQSVDAFCNQKRKLC